MWRSPKVPAFLQAPRLLSKHEQARGKAPGPLLDDVRSALHGQRSVPPAMPVAMPALVAVTMIVVVMMTPVVLAVPLVLDFMQIDFE